MKVSVNCPSYKRHQVDTLKYLPFCKVWVDESEFDQYKKLNPEAQIISCKKGIQGNLCRIRNHIMKTEFSNGFDVVCIVDDDMKGMFYWENKEKKKVESDEFIPFLEKYSIMAKDLGAYFWGVNVSHDKQSYRENVPFSTVSYIGGPFQVFLKGNEIYYDERLPLKEDYDMTLQQLNKYRVVLRANKFFYSVKQSEQAGGCATYRNLEREKKQLEMLQKKWGKKIVRIDNNNRSHNLKKEKTKIDYNPIIKPPIKGI
jgi:hypothetical protein